MKALVVRGLTVGFSQRRPDGQHRFVALAEVDLDVEEGAFVVVVGPSGCGKSTLLRVCNGLLPAHSGEVLVYGTRVTGPGPERAMVFQHHNLLPWRTALANVEFGLEIAGVPPGRRRDQAAQYLELVGLGGFFDYYPHQLSGGMQQRVGLARALTMEPRVLLMDEPFGSLDAQTRVIMQDELARILSRDRKTALFVTHDIEEAMFLADRIAVMSPSPGRIMEVIEVPFDRPRSDHTRALPEFARMKERIWGMLKPHQLRLSREAP